MRNSKLYGILQFCRKPDAKVFGSAALQIFSLPKFIYKCAMLSVALPICFKRGWFSLIQYISKHFHAETGKVWHVSCNHFLSPYTNMFSVGLHKVMLINSTQISYKMALASKLLFSCLTIQKYFDKGRSKDIKVIPKKGSNKTIITSWMVLGTKSLKSLLER